MSKLAFKAQTVDIAYLPFRQDLFAKNVLMTAQRDFRLSNSLFTFAPITSSMRVNKVAGKSVVFEQGSQLHHFVA